MGHAIFMPGVEKDDGTRNRGKIGTAANFSGGDVMKIDKSARAPEGERGHRGRSDGAVPSGPLSGPRRREQGGSVRVKRHEGGCPDLRSDQGSLGKGMD
jgi:hypothetical protein